MGSGCARPDREYAVHKTGRDNAIYFSGAIGKPMDWRLFVCGTTRILHMSCGYLSYKSRCWVLGTGSVDMRVVRNVLRGHSSMINNLPLANVPQIKVCLFIASASKICRIILIYP